MRLQVTGVETLEVVVPPGYRKKRKVIDPADLDKLRGRTFTTQEIKDVFGYAKTTALADTQLRDHIEQVEDRRKLPATNAGARWRVI
ncbi:hypothetical protein LCGC14_0978180 [marine sediment metagenome]|uniref:Uncharacterized protein n=1 Tax=marine sediment metagenome TaxID=412755 RepID=A0A0F9N9L5_9ZZZZ